MQRRRAAGRDRHPDGRRVTTHWASADDVARSLSRDHRCSSDEIYVHDGAWTSAGVTAGIDLALQLMAHIAHHPDADPSVGSLASQVNMSEGSFQRLFTSEVGISPGKYVERARIDAARALLEPSEDGLAAIALRCGFASPETFLRSFRRVVDVNPTEYGRRFPTHV